MPAQRLSPSGGCSSTVAAALPAYMVPSVWVVRHQARTTNWRANLPAFAPHFACVAWDARGYGGSDDYDGPLAFDDFVADVLRVADHFGVQRLHLLGLSMGGRIAMRTALLHPQRVATLSLVDTHEGFESFTAEQRQAFVDSRRAPLLAGLVVGKAELVKEVRMHGLRYLTGATLSPLTAFLVMRGLKTLELRMKQHSQSATAISSFLAGHRHISSLSYLGSV